MRSLVLAMWIVPALAFAGPGGERPARRPSPVVVENGLTAEQINRVIVARAGAFRFCYQRELTRNPAAAKGGKIVVAFRIEPNGNVERARVRSSTMKILTVERCIVSTVRRLKFPASEAPSDVSYPFVFTAAA